MNPNFTQYQLPCGRIVDVFADVARNAPVIDYQLADGRIVPAVRYVPLVGYASSETAYGRTVGYGFAVKVF